MNPISIARTYLGTKEIPGEADNPKIMEMYRTIGQDWVQHDELAWCAAFVGHCLELSGVLSTRKLNARSYLAWGEKVDGVETAKEGDIVVFSRGASAVEGHVAFFLKVAGSSVEVLGGNQTNSVSIARFPKSRLLGIRRTIDGEAAQKPDLLVIQRRLQELGYHEVGAIDGRYGPRTRAAILAFRADNALTLTPDLDPELLQALESAPKRHVGLDRAEGGPDGSRIIAAANAQITTGIAGILGMATTVITPALDTVQSARDVTERTLGLFNLTSRLMPIVPWVSGVLFIIIIVLALRAKAARMDDHRTGKTP
jgi:uncharacterized protein (TIGR02594 family)